MEEKKTTEISISTFLLVLAIIGLVVMGIVIYKISNDKSAEEKKSAELQSQVNSLNATVNQLQEKVETFSNNDTTTSSDTVEKKESNVTKNNSTSFSEEQIKKAFSDYLELDASTHCGTPLDVLKDKGKINYDLSKSTVNTNNGKVTTNVKFSDYKKAMLNYVTESEFNRNWTSKINLNEDSNGYLTHLQGGGALRVYTVNSINTTDNLTYSAKTTVTIENDASTKSTEEFTFTIKSYNGNCVIDSVTEV